MEIFYVWILKTSTLCINSYAQTHWRREHELVLSSQVSILEAVFWVMLLAKEAFASTPLQLPPGC